MAKKGISEHYDQTGFRFSIMVLAILALVALYVTTPSNSGGFYGANSIGKSNIVGAAVASQNEVAQPTSTQAYICSDGTYANKCSYNKPMFCSGAGQLVNNCIKCGCPSGKYCSTGGSCSASTPLQMKTYIEDDLDYNAEAVRYTQQSSRGGNGLNFFGYQNGPKVITKDDYPALTLPNNGLIYSASGASVTENQRLFLFAYTHYDATAKVVQAQFAKTGYEVSFNSGLPLCLNPPNFLYANCPTSKQLKNSNIKIWLLGSSWYIRDYAVNVNSSGDYENVTMIKLVREDGLSMTLQNDKQAVLSRGSSPNWKSSLFFSPPGSTGVNLGAIRLYNDIDQAYKVPVTQTLNAGEGIDIIKGIPGYKFNYLGLEAAENDNLQFSILKSQTFSDSAGNIYAGNFLMATSGISNAFQFPGRSTNQVYIGLEGSSNNNTNGTGGNGTGGNATNNSQNIAGKVFYLDASGYMKDYWSNGVSYHYTATESAQILASVVLYNGVVIQLAEKTEDNANAYSSTSDKWHFNLYYDNNYDQFENSPGVNIIDKIGYSFGSAAIVYGNKASGFISNRGTIFNGISANSASFSYPKTIVHALYSVSYNGDDIVWPNTGGNIK